MTLVNAYCTVDELLIHIESTDDVSSAMTNRAEQAIYQASRFIDLYTGRVFYTITLTAEKVDIYSESENGLMLDYDRHNVLIAPAPFLTITSITEDGTALTVDTDFYKYNPSTDRVGDGKLIKDNEGLWSKNHKAIVITGTIGYASTPWVVKNICIEIASLIMRAKESFLTSGSGDLVGQFEQILPKTTYQTLKLLRRKIVV